VQTFSLPLGSDRLADQELQRKARSEALFQPSWEQFGTVRAGCDLPNSSQPVTEEEPMSDPRFTRPDLCSISAATGQVESTGAVRGLPILEAGR